MHADGSPLQAGDRLVQADLAKTLEHIAAQGPGYFYRGAFAKTVVEASAADGGILGLKDFEAYRSEELRPLHCSYHGYDVVSVPPPSLAASRFARY